MSRRILTAAFLALAASGVAFSGPADPPGRAGRLSYVQGEVVLQPGSGPPEEAELNLPLTLGDRLMTSHGSRAELSLGTAAIRLDESTDLLVGNLDYDIAQIELNSGTLAIHVRALREAEILEIDTPNAVVTLRRPGDYRVAVDAQGATMLAVRNGEAELDGGAGAIRLFEQQELRFTGIEQLADVTPLGRLDAFDEWSIERERDIADAESTRYVSRDVVGYEDLDRHGRWWSEPGYGHVWAPRVVIAGWAPYRFGHWKWISPWGWTWVDHAPWGFAPFHFGRWAFIRHRWCWVPGPRRHRPIYGPAHVAWRDALGERARAHHPQSWLPLAPREVYVPRHPASPRYLRNVNISNTVIEDNARITNVARNRVRNLRSVNDEVPGAVTSIPRSAFHGPSDAARRIITASPRQPARPLHRELTRRAVDLEPRRAVPSDDDIARHRDRRADGVRTEPARTLRPEREQRALPSLSRRISQPRALSVPSRNADRQAGRSVGRPDDGGRSRSSGGTRPSVQTPRAAESPKRSHAPKAGGRAGRAGFATKRR